MNNLQQDFSKTVNRIVVNTLLILIIALTAVYLTFGIKGLLKAPEDTIRPNTPPELTAEEKEKVLDGLEDSQNPIDDGAAFKALKSLDADIRELSPQEKKDILNSL